MLLGFDIGGTECAVVLGKETIDETIEVNGCSHGLLVESPLKAITLSILYLNRFTVQSLSSMVKFHTSSTRSKMGRVNTDLW
jgi:hypothetical protein